MKKLNVYSISNLLIYVIYCVIEVKQIFVWYELKFWTERFASIVFLADVNSWNYIKFSGDKKWPLSQ